MVFNRKRKDNRSSSFILDDSPKRTKVQAQRKFAQGSNVNSPVLTPVTEIEIQEKVMPEPIELQPMKRPNTEDFLTFLCFRGTPALPQNLNFFNNASMTEAPPPMSESPNSSKNGVILPANISKTQGEKPFIAFGVRKRADPIVVSRHMDKKRRHALALQALRRKYQEQKMAKIRAITISKLSEKVHTNKTVVRTTRSVTKAEPVAKKPGTQKTKITVVATKHVKVTTRRTSTQIKQSGNTKQKMCLRSLRNRVVKRELVKKNHEAKQTIKKSAKKKEVNYDDDEEDDDEEDDEVVNEDDGEEEESSEDEESLKNNKKSSVKTSDLRVTRSNLLATRRNKRMIIRQQNMKSPTSPRLRAQLRRKILQKAEVKVPLVTKRRILTRKVQIKAKTVSKKIETKSSVKKELPKPADKVSKVEEKRSSLREINKKLAVASVKKKPVKIAETKKEITKVEDKKMKDTESPTIAKKTETKVKKPADDKKKTNEEKIKKEVDEKIKIDIIEEKNKKPLDDKIEKKSLEEKPKKLSITESKIPVEKKIQDDKSKKSVPKVRKSEDTSKNIDDLPKKKVLDDKNKKSNTENQKTEVMSPDDKKTFEKRNEGKVSTQITEVTKKKVNEVQKKSPKIIEIKETKINEVTSISEEKPTIGENTGKNTEKEISNVETSSPQLQLPIIESNRIIIDKDIVIEEVKPFKLGSPSPKVDKEEPKNKSTEKKSCLSKTPAKKVEKKKLEETPPKLKNEVISQRPSRKTKLAAAIYMEILGRKLVNDEDVDDLSNDSFPELPNVRRMEQRENELKAKMKGGPAVRSPLAKTEKKVKEIENAEKNSAKSTQPAKSKPKVSDKQKSNADSESTKLRTRNSSPKGNKKDSESDNEVVGRSKKRKSDAASDLEVSKTKKQSTKKKSKNDEDSFSDSDEEPLSKLTVKASQKSKSETESCTAVKQKRECTKRPQNYLALFSSSDEEEKFYRPMAAERAPAKKKAVKTVEQPPVLPEALSTKDIGRRFGKGKVNMSNEQIEKWLNDSALAGMTLIKAENDEMLKFGERIPTETSLDNNLSAVNTDQLKNTLLKTEIKEVLSPPPKTPPILQSTPEKSSESSPQKPPSNEKKTIFRKTEKTSKNTNAFSACNESSVYAFEADNEDSVSTPFRRPSRRPSSTATSRSEDDLSRLIPIDQDNKSRFRLPTNVSNKMKQEVSLMLTDESNNSGSITVQVNLASADADAPNQSENEHMFYIPFQPGQKAANIQGVAIKMGTTEGSTNPKLIMSAKLVRQNSSGSIPDKAPMTPMFPPSSPIPFKKQDKSKASCSMSETSDDFKYKVPSSPSASSSSSAKLVHKRKINEEFYKPINSTEFPNLLNPAQIVEAPLFHPTEKEFADPLEYIEKIREKAERFGICRIIPPSNFKPECKVLDEMRFTAYNQYVHKMMHRWGPNFRELVAIRKYLATQSISLKHPPWIGGIEIDLPKLYQTVQLLGGLKEVIEKKKWPRVSELMKIPKSAQDRVTKLDDIYCKYLLPYDTLSPDEREKLFASVETDWAKRESKLLEKARNGTNINLDEEEEEESDEDSDETDVECIVKGRSMALSAFYRIARNTMAMWFKENDPTPQEVEEEFWKHVIERQHHICVHSGSIDSGNFGYGFAVTKNSPFARHAWNLKVLTNNSGSILRSMGPVMGLTVPTLHVGMLYAGCCWYRDPHSLPWIEYLHTGANKIWYGIPDSMSNKFHEVMTKLVPHYCLNKSLWLPTDTVMVPPSTLVDNGVSLTKTIQEPGQFIVVFPKAFTSNICAGYVVSESVFWAPPDWLNGADQVFLELRNSCEPSMFSYERLLLSMAEDTRTDAKVLRKIIPPIERMIAREKLEREKVKSLGIKKTERLPLLDAKRKKKMQDTDTEYICEDCRWNLYCSMICDTQENGFYCLEHAVENINEKRIEVEHCKLMYTYDDDELNGFVDKIYAAIEAKLVKKVGSKFSGMATLLNR